MIKKAVILAAGLGTRLMPHTKTVHKCLTTVNDVPIIVNALYGLYKIGVEETIIVVGYLAENIKNIVGYMFETMKIQYVENSIYESSNTSYSLKLGLQSLKNYDLLYLLEGDVFFEKRMLVTLDGDSHENVTILEPYNETLDGTFVSVDEQNYVIDWIHKNCRDENFTLHDKYKTVNIHKFSKKFINEMLLPALVKTETINLQEPLERVMQDIVRANHNIIYGIQSDGIKWVEIDNEEDLKLAKKIFGDDNNGVIERALRKI